MVYDKMQLEMQDYIENMNKVKDAVIGRLLQDKVITQEQADIYSEKWQIMIFKNSWFKKWLKKFNTDSDEKEWSFKYLKFED